MMPKEPRRMIFSRTSLAPRLQLLQNRMLYPETIMQARKRQNTLKQVNFIPVSFSEHDTPDLVYNHKPERIDFS
eukprot:scaffold3953_cov169-Amphora_coffeaeformis.AAC.23